MTLADAETNYLNAMSEFGEDSNEAECARWQMVALLPDEVLARHAVLLAESGALEKPVCILAGCPVYDIERIAENLRLPYHWAAPALKRIVLLANKHVTIH